MNLHTCTHIMHFPLYILQSKIYFLYYILRSEGTSRDSVLPMGKWKRNMNWEYQGMSALARTQTMILSSPGHWPHRQSSSLWCLCSDKAAFSSSSGAGRAHRGPVNAARKMVGGGGEGENLSPRITSWLHSEVPSATQTCRAQLMGHLRKSWGRIGDYWGTCSGRGFFQFFQWGSPWRNLVSVERQVGAGHWIKFTINIDVFCPIS